MKVGDLVTLSAYGENLCTLVTYSAYYRNKYYNKNALVGIIVGVREAGRRNGKYFYVRWLNESDPSLVPQSRDGRWGATFWRKDLKHVRRAEDVVYDP